MAATPARLSRAARLWLRLRGYRGALERIEGGVVSGWAARRGDPAPLAIELHGAEGRLISGRADAFRADLTAAGIGEGRHAFALPVPPALWDASGEITLRIAGHTLDLAQLNLPGRAVSSAPPSPDALARHLFGPLLRLRAALPATDAAPPLRPHQALFAQSGAVADALPSPLFAYTDFIRHRENVAEHFPHPEAPHETDAFLRWYLADYGARRKGVQLPMTREAIDWLNTKVDGLSRAMRIFGLSGSEPEKDLCRWSAEIAPALGVGDCLVPETARARLSRPLASEPWPLTPFTAHLHATTPALRNLDPGSEADRQRLVLSVVLLALEHPEFLGYLPNGAAEQLLDSGALSAFVQSLRPGPLVSRDQYAAALRREGFDLDRKEFLRSAEGHRIEAARRPRPTGPRVDIQILGPFRKAAGLGQSTRLSHHILQHCDYSLNAVDYSRDNPAPSGAGAPVTLGAPRPARINLLHLNAEAVPDAFAFEPDIFSGAYNIAYVYWELDSPALCHQLALELVDEIWVSSDYCAQTYRGATSKPVTNVGMCFQPPPEIDRDAARRALHRQLGVGTPPFTFLASFDSFSYLQRKNPLGTLRAFSAAFPTEQTVRLVIKTQNRQRVSDPAQAALWAEIDQRIAADPRITLIDETLAYGGVLELMAGADCYASLHRSEGWGFGMLEGMALGVPVLCTGYSGNLEFCDEETAWLVPARSVEPGPQDYIFVTPGQHWGEPDHAAAVAQMRAVRSDAAARMQKAARARERVRRDFSVAAIARRYDARLKEIFAALASNPGENTSAR
ncbi:glycosyltransferase [Thioclava atlantica]|uniref:Group 1 glycosyl transferase n=1 Tax=Thioclava atlantica TaxID=1317124 RepID=A0A085TRW7_9RHOB|nr:glycosyltransferase [Thioclava atlantica]KFE33464.1 group 1 glycosyl transferase [Thioclava atlantica]